MGDADQSVTPAKRAEIDARTIDVDGNSLTLIPDGPERFEALIALIDGAKSNLRLLYYTYRADASGDAVRDALMRAIERGVKVALLIDGFGSSATPDTYFTELAKAGTTFCRFNPSYGRRYLLRNHQKLALADGARVLIGGFNIGDDYFGRSADGAWRDIGLMVVGPAAPRLAPYFDALMDWAQTKGARMRNLRRLIYIHSETKGLLQWQFGAPMRRLSPSAVSTYRDLVQANDVEMIAAYFAPTRGILKRISRRGPLYLQRADAAWRRGLRISTDQIAFQAAGDGRHRPHRFVEFRHPQPLFEPGVDAAGGRCRVRWADATIFRG
jgi:cardiolipin synthase